MASNDCSASNSNSENLQNLSSNRPKFLQQLKMNSLSAAKTEILSPMTDLTLNLHGLTTKSSSFTPKRRISWSSDSPIKPFLLSKECLGDSPLYIDSPTFENRILKDLSRDGRENSPKKNQANRATIPPSLDCGEEPAHILSSSTLGPSAETGLNIHRAGLRRLRSLPPRRVTPLVEKENVTPSASVPSETQDQCPQEAGDEVVATSVLGAACSPVSRRSSTHVSRSRTNSGGSASPVSSGARFCASRSLSMVERHSNRSLLLSECESLDSGYVPSDNERRRASLNSVTTEQQQERRASVSSTLSETDSDVFQKPRGIAPRKSSGYRGGDQSRKDSGRSSVASSLTSLSAADDPDSLFHHDGFTLEFFDNYDMLDKNASSHQFRDLLTEPIMCPLDKECCFITNPLAVPLPLPDTSTNSIKAQTGRVGRSFSMVESIDCQNVRRNALKEHSELEENRLPNGDSPPSLLPLNRKRIFDRDVVAVPPFKRPEPPGEGGFLLESKRRKSVLALVKSRNEDDTWRDANENHAVSTRHSPVVRSLSMSDVVIDSALKRSEEEFNLTGDYSVRNTLPVMKGRHPDLKTISSETLRDLVSGKISGVQSFTVVDCRFPYEFEGGHIQGAKNFFTKESLYNQFLLDAVNKQQQNSTPSGAPVAAGRNVLIFHCEFSSERGPNMYRFLRQKDRDANKDNYPNLFYPELYLLEGGYKKFFTDHKELCEPQEYLPMNHKDFKKQLSHFRAKSKSWNGDKQRHSVRPGLKF